MRRIYRKQYQPPARKKPVKTHSVPLVQPEWDDTIHDLGQLKLSPQELLHKKLSRISKNQLGVAVLGHSKPLSGEGSSRYTASLRSAEDAHNGYESDSEASSRSTDEENDVMHRSEQQRHHVLRSTAVGANTGYGDGDSDDDLCQWQGAISSPLHDHRPVPHDIGNSSNAQRQSQQQQQQQHRSQSAAHHKPGGTAGAAAGAQGGRLVVEAGVLQVLLDKIEALEQQLQQQQQQQVPAANHALQQQELEQDLRQQLSSSQQQLSTTQQQLSKLQDEYRQYVAHSSSLLSRLQAQLQQLMSAAPGLVLGQAAGADEATFPGELAKGLAGMQTASTAAAAEPEATTRRAAAAAAAAAAADAWQPPCSSIQTAPTAIPGLRSSSAGGKSPAKSQLRPATTVSVTALPCRPPSAAGSTGSSYIYQPFQPAAAGDGSSGAAVHAREGSMSGTAAQTAAEAVALPSYAEMRQRTFAAKASLLAPAPAASAALGAGMAAAATAAAGGGEDSSSYEAYLRGTVTASSRVGELPYSRAVPSPIPAANAAAAAAAALSGGSLTAANLQAAPVPGSWSNAAQAAPVISADQPARCPPIALSPAIAVDSSLPGLKDVDWGLLQGLPRAAVSRILTAAGRAEGVEGPRPRVLLGELQGNVSLTDHLRAAKAAAAAAAKGQAEQQTL